MKEFISIFNNSNARHLLTSLLDLVSDFSTNPLHMKPEHLRFQIHENIGVFIYQKEIVVCYKLNDRLVNGREYVKHKAVKIIMPNTSENSFKKKYWNILIFLAQY